MSGYIGAKNKVAKRFAVNLWGKSRNPLSNKKGFRVTKKKSEYGIRLDEKQKLKFFYGGIREKQFSSYYKKAKKKGGNLGNTFLQLLECRLDVLVYRLNLAPTIFAARQLVSHGHIKVNDQKVDISSFTVKPKDTIEIKEKSKELGLIQASIKSTERTIPSYVSLDSSKLTGILERIPERENIVYPFVLNESLIIEFYSK